MNSSDRRGLQCGNARSVAGYSRNDSTGNGLGREAEERGTD